MNYLAVCSRNDYYLPPPSSPLAWPGRIISHTEREEDGLTPPPDGKVQCDTYLYSGTSVKGNSE